MLASPKRTSRRPSRRFQTCLTKAKCGSGAALQEVYLNFLKNIGLIEDNIPDPGEVGTGATVYYNLGMFSEVISDFETIHFTSKPDGKYKTFAYWVENDAPDYYDEGGLRWQLPHAKCGGYHDRSPVQRTAVASRVCAFIAAKPFPCQEARRSNRVAHHS